MYVKWHRVIDCGWCVGGLKRKMVRKVGESLGLSLGVSMDKTERQTHSGVWG